MEASGLVSIIIPTYNRAHLIGETLETILSQTYTNWECIVVDDGSTDATEDVVRAFLKKDNRFHFHKRPGNKPKGGNACRNYGFEKSFGEFIKWFDSDDLMMPNHIEVLVESIKFAKVDFAVGDSINFIKGQSINKKPYRFSRKEAVMDAAQYAQHQIGWITDDFLGRRMAIESISFNERLRAGQEYNFFIRLLLQNTNGIFVDKVLTKARLHNGSLSNLTQKRREQHQEIIAEIKLLTLEDIYFYGNNYLNKWFLSGYIQIAYSLALKKNKPPYLYKGIIYIYKLQKLNKSISFIFSLITAYSFGIGYRLNKYARK